jgi:hypothetical protein
MATKTFAGLNAAAALTGAEIVPVVQGGADRRTTTSAIAAALLAADAATVAAVLQGTGLTGALRLPQRADQQPVRGLHDRGG